MSRHAHCHPIAVSSKGYSCSSGLGGNPQDNKNNKETMMRNEIKIVEDGVIFELEIEEVEEVVAPAVIVGH